MRFRLRAALLAVLVAAAAAGCNGRNGVLGPQYQYEEDLTLSLDGSATLVVNASIPALVALRGFSLDTSPRARVDLLAPRCASLSVANTRRSRASAQWTRSGRRFVGVRLRIPDVRAAAEGGAVLLVDVRAAAARTARRVFRQTLGAPASSRRACERWLDRQRDRRVPAASAQPHPVPELARPSTGTSRAARRAGTSSRGSSA